MSSKIKPEVWKKTMEALNAELQILLETHDRAMMEAVAESPVSKIKLEIKTKIDLSHKTHQFDVSLSFEPVVLKQKDSKSIIGDDPDQMKLNLQGAPGVPEPEPEPPKEKSKKSDKPKVEPKAQKKPVDPPKPAPKSKAKDDDDEEEAWGKPSKRG